MASDFVGYTVILTLFTPPNGKLQGVVGNVIGQQLVLHDVTLLWNGQRFPSYVVDSTRIADLEVGPERRNENAAPPPAPGVSSTPRSGIQSSELSAVEDNIPSVPAKHAQFVDPAILSYAKPRLDTRGISHKPVVQSVASPVMIGDSIGMGGHAAIRQSGASPVMIGDSFAATTPTTVVHHEPPQKGRTNSTATAILTTPFDGLQIGAGPKVPAQGDGVARQPGPETAEPSATKDATKKGRRGKKGGKDVGSQTGPGIIDIKDLASSPIATKKPGKGKGWRETPLIEEATPRKGKHSKNKKSLTEDANGWATEDATDIQDMGEFDFQSNLSKFNKRQVFDDIRSKDTTADADRLVSFNRKARPGTNGGKNLHYTENVLDAPDVTSQWKSEAGETEDEIQEERYSSSRASRRGQSTTRAAPTSRKGSTILNQLLPNAAGSRTESPRPSISRTGTNASPLNGSTTRGAFRLADSNKPCTTLSPLQMLEIEQVCTAELGIAEDMLTENAARGIAETALKHATVSIPNGNILVLAGNHKSGARAIAAARHLRNRNMRVLLCILGSDREDLLLESLRRQLDIYQRSGGKTVKFDELQSRLSEWSPHLIIEALLSVHIAFEELRFDQQASTFEMIRWINRSNVPIFSVDVPSGLIATTSEVTQTDSGPLIVYSTNIICLGAPKNCLLDVLSRDADANTSWQVSVADIGISSAAWKKYGTRRRHGIEFGKEWVIDLTYHA